MSTALQTQSDNPQLEALARIAMQETPREEIRERPGRGGIKLKYTDGAYVIRTLNEAFGWDWDFETDNEELLLNNGVPFEVKVRGKLTVRLKGQAVTKMQFGCQPIEMLRNGVAPVSIGDCYKGAATDAMKKCASLLGIALDLYDSDSPIHTNGASGQQKPQPRKQEPERAMTDKEKADVARVKEIKNKPKFSPENRNHSPEIAKRLDAVIETLLAHDVSRDEILRETNCALVEMNLPQVSNRYEIGEQGASAIVEGFQRWVNALDRSAREK